MCRHGKGDTDMMRRAFVLLALVVSLSGCSMAYFQEKMDLLNSAYKAENEKIIATLGTKYYKIEPEKAHSAMLLALGNLEGIVDNQDARTGFISFKARTPRPLSTEEFQAMAKIEEARARQITGLPVTMTAGKSEIRGNVILISRKDDVQINIRFSLVYLQSMEGLVVGDQPPPEAVRLGLKKVWDEFEKVAFVQGKVVYGSP